MENSQLKDLQEEVSEATKQYILTTFNSENGKTERQMLKSCESIQRIAKESHPALARRGLACIIKMLKCGLSGKKAAALLCGTAEKW